MMDEQNQLVTTNEVFDQVWDALETAWDALYTNPQATQALAIIHQGFQQMQAAMNHSEALAASALAAAEDFKSQRDLALNDLDWQKREKSGMVLRQLARYLAYDGQVAVGDAERALEVLFGEKDLPISEYTKQDFFNAFGVLAEELFAEELFQEAAEAEYQAEIDQQRSYDDDNE
jgi:hypothetical protein